jgi:GntR family transcriptional regulator/MocR family aminotransferase
MPSSRSLSHDLGISRNTVVSAYDQLLAEGWLSARQGSGTWVAEGRAFDSVVDALTETGRHNDLIYDMSPGTPDLSGFPRAAWMAAAKRAITDAPDTRLGYGDPRGTLELRLALAEYLGRTRGVVASEDRVVICSGAVQGLFLSLRTLAEFGIDTVAVESACFDISRQQIDRADMDLVPLSVDHDGVRVDQLIRSRAQVVLLTPAHQFPWGVPLSAERRGQVIRWAQATGGMIIEDDYDGEFRYDRRPIGALQGLAPDHVIYQGSASKALAPGIRIGWMVLPEPMVKAITALRQTIDLHTGVFEQLALAEFIRAGAYDRHIRKARLRYRNRRDQLAAMLDEHAPHVGISGIAAGLHALLTLPGDLTIERDTLARARDVGLSLAGLSRFRCEPKDSDQGGLVVGYGATPNHSFPAALNLLRRILPARVAGA